MPLTMPPMLNSFLKEKLPKEDPKEITKALNLYFECKVLGIDATPKNGPVKNTCEYYTKWQNITEDLWGKLITENRKINATVKYLNQQLFDIDEDLYNNNDGLDEIEKKVAGLAAMTTAKNLLMQHIENIDKEDTKTLNKATDDAIVLMMLITIIIGTTKDSHIVFFHMMDQAIEVYGFDPEQENRHKANPKESKRLQKLFDEYFAETFRTSLSTFSCTENYVIDVVSNDKARDFITEL